MKVLFPMAVPRRIVGDQNVTYTFVVHSSQKTPIYNINNVTQSTMEEER